MVAASTLATPIAVMSFDRPDYLRQVLATLKVQVPAVSPDRVCLFQDGNRVAGTPVTDDRLIEKCVAEFQEAFPQSKVFASAENLGVALNFNRAEQYFFEECGAASAIFFEDDLMLSPFYVETMERLLQLAQSNERIAYVAAYGDHHAQLQAQRQNAAKLMLMRHKWGFALTRRQWLKQRPLIDPYLEIVARKGYRQRDHQEIFQYYRKLGYGSPGTSQDAMKDVASAVLGTTKIMTYACFGKNIGKTGLHSRPEFYDKEGFDRTEIFPERVAHFEPPSESVLTGYVNAIRGAALQALDRA
jgi:hypothetical protein